MSFSGARTVLDAHLVAAGAAIAPAITNVERGASFRLSSRMIRNWYAGDGDSDLIPDTLTDNTVRQRIAVGAYWPIPDGGELDAEAIDSQIVELMDEITNRLTGDTKLGGNVSHCDIGDFAVEYLEVTGGWYAALLTEVGLHFTDTYTFAD